MAPSQLSTPRLRFLIPVLSVWRRRSPTAARFAENDTRISTVSNTIVNTLHPAILISSSILRLCLVSRTTSRPMSTLLVLVYLWALTPWVTKSANQLLIHFHHRLHCHMLDIATCATPCSSPNIPGGALLLGLHSLLAAPSSAVESASTTSGHCAHLLHSVR